MVDIPGLVNVYITMKHHHFQWENPLFLWSFSIAFCMFTGGYISIYIYIWESSPKGRTFRVGVKQSRMIIFQWCRYSIWWIMKFLDAQFPDKSSRCTESGVAWSKVYPQQARSDAWRPFRGTGVLRWSTMINLRILCLFMFIWLVVWDIWIIFPYMGIIIPTDFHIFQRGRHTTNQWLFISACAMDQTSWHPNLRTL